MAKEKKVEETAKNTDVEITLIKDFQYFEGGRVIPSGSVFIVTNEKAAEMAEGGFIN